MILSRTPHETRKPLKNLIKISWIPSERLSIGALAGYKIKEGFKHFLPFKVKQNEIGVAKAQQAHHNKPSQRE